MDLLQMFYGHPLTFDPVEIAMIYFLWRMNKSLADIKIAGIKRDLKLDGLARDFHVERQATEKRFGKLEPVLRRI
jgi:hypothetical protein